MNDGLSVCRWASEDWWEYTEGLYVCGLFMGEAMDAACISYRSASDSFSVEPSLLL